MMTPRLFLGLCLLVLLSACEPEAESPDYTTTKWENLTLDFRGPATSEMAGDNPFVNYRLDVVFTQGENSITIPGYYAADGNAAETSADSGNVWRVNFRPDRVGEWEFETIFRRGPGIIYEDDFNAGELLASLDQVGTVKVTAAAAGETGRLVRTHPRYLQWAETKKYFLKGGADSPENLLGYEDFDGTYRHSNNFREGESKTEGLHKYKLHAQDFTGGPTWQDGKGKHLMGAISYLANKGINSIYFLTNNIGGDGKDVWPWIDHETFDRFDVSKLAQWERVFEHADDLGMMLHFVLQETENETMLDDGDMGPLRKLYYRELIARFAHHRAVTWNLGEENGPNDWSETYQTNEQQEAGIAWLAEHDPYANYIVLHTHPGEEAFAKIYEPLLGNSNLGGLSLQMGNPYEAHAVTKKWLALSKEAGAPWLMTVDETGPWYRGLDPDTGYTVDNGKSNNHDSLRAYTLWGNLMAGGGGVEWYFGAKNTNNDLNAEDWRSRDQAWEWTAATLQFFQDNIPFAEMENHDELVDNGAFCLSYPDGGAYLVFLPQGEATTLTLMDGDVSGFTLKWFHPKTGKLLAEEDIMSEQGKLLLTPPGEGDWAAWLSAS